MLNWLRSFLAARFQGKSSVANPRPRVALACNLEDCDSNRAHGGFGFLDYRERHSRTGKLNFAPTVVFVSCVGRTRGFTILVS